MNSKNIKSHYNNLKGVKLRDRHKSKIINIRSMNNFIKSILIRKYATKKVLDIGCGKGGDLKKYLQTGIHYYCGLDIADKSIEEAESRYNFMKNRYKEGKQYNRRDKNGVKQAREEDRKDETEQQAKGDEKDTAMEVNNDAKRNGIFEADFICADCYNEPFDVKQTFDTISCQFSFHYSFASEKTFNTTLENVNQHLKEDGYFILTIPNSQTLLRRYHNYKNNYGNEYYKVSFKNTYDEIKDMVFGIEYFFNLEEAIENCVEYLVDFKVLKKGLEKYNIECILHKDMLTFFNANVNDNMELYKDMMKNRLNNDELKVIELYSVAVFKKVSKPKTIDD